MKDDDYQEEEKEPKEEATAPEGPVLEVNEKELNEALEAYYIREKELKPSFIADLKNSNPKITDKATIELKLTNKIYTKREYILDLQNFLKERLNNAFIKININLQAEKAENKRVFRRRYFQIKCFIMLLLIYQRPARAQRYAKE